jgi:hypothetical protein
VNELNLYLNEHLAGSVAALELIDHILTVYPADPFFATLRRDVAEDQAILQHLVESLGFREHAMLQFGAWIAEKLIRIKVQLHDSQAGHMDLFYALEVLTLGITGKKLLWRALAAANVGDLNYPQLEQRAQKQLELTEIKRLDFAELALPIRDA